MADFLERALLTVSKGVPVIRLRPRSKAAYEKNWPALATTDPDVLRKWDLETPDANCGAVAQAKLGGTFFFEIDDPSVVHKIEADTGKRLPKTWRVRSRVGRGHYYLRQTPNSVALGNVSQNYVKGGNFSVRVDNEYVVSANSIHPISDKPYEIVSTAEIAEAPDWLIDWIKSQRTSSKVIDASLDGDIIPFGQHDSELTRIAGKLRHSGMEVETLKFALTEICEKRCENHGTDYREMCEKIATSVSRYPIGKDDSILISGIPAGTALATAYGVAPAKTIVSELVERPELSLPPFPKFPRWVFQGTSIYEGLVKPYCDKNSRYPEYMWLPAMAILLNYVANKVRVEERLLIPSLFMVLIGRRGQVIKSSSVESAIEYFKFAGMVDHGSQVMSNADGKSLVWEIGSPEGLGIEMNRLQCRNGILFYDELSTLTNKAAIEGSTLTSRLLAMYESGKFQNLIKSRRDSFSFDPGSYCISLIACSTEKNFLPSWSKLSGKTSGLDDRFMFLYQPETLIPLTPHIYVDTHLAAIETRKLVDKAIAQGVFKISNSSPLRDKIGEIGNRAEIRAEKFALGLAIDMGREELDEDSIERALAIISYEAEVKKWLSTFEASTKEGAIQLEVVNHLVRSKGVLPLRDLKRMAHADRYGTSLWSQSYKGLLTTGKIREEGSGRKEDPKVVILMEAPEDDD